MHSPYSRISIIYNPNSTGDSLAEAKSIYEELKAIYPKVTVDLMPTKKAGHAWELARDAAALSGNPLLVSVSGDGGYNEVVNGVMESGNNQAICAVLPAGNANDHSRTMQDGPLLELIKAGKTTRLDLIKVSTGGGVERYAHSYAGVGLTPVVAVELNKSNLNAIKELWLAIKVFYKYRPFTILHKGKKLRLNSLLFANINQMAKVLTLAKENRPDDGKFEIIVFPKDKKLELLKRLAISAVAGLDTSRRESRYTFKTLKDMPIQLDGEVMKLKAGTEVKVESIPGKLRTLV